MTNDWQPHRLWRVLDNDGRVWMETSNEAEASTEAVAKNYEILRLWVRSEEEWRDV